ncbi:MAG: DedA family protein [Bacteroidaceae bacterium]|nr:DedA family protein [Bacteroidaceae bacterium]
MEQFIIELFRGALENLNYGWVILLMAIESSFIPFPSEVVMIPAAYMACADGEMSIPIIILCGTAGALIGAFINYGLSYWLGRPIVYRFANSRFGHMCLIDQKKVEKAEQYFDSHGAISTLIGRMIPAIRQLISIPAGLAKMNLGSFTLYTCLGAAIWNAILVGIGVACHKAVDKETLIQTISHYSHIIGYAAIAICLLIIVYLIWQGVKKERK